MMSWCCADSVVIIWNRDVTYTELKTLPNENFCGAEYKHGDIILNLHDINDT